MAAAVANEIADNEKIGNETRFLDDFHLDFQPVNDRFDGGCDNWIIKREIIFRAGDECRQAFWIVHARNDEFISLRFRVNRVAGEKSLGEPLPQKTFAREMFRRMKHRIMQILRRLRKFDFQIALVRDLARVQHRLGNFGKTRLHFLRAAQKKLFRHIARAHALGIAQQILRADAHKAVVRVRIAFVDIVNVIGADEFQAELLCPRNEEFVDLDLFGNAVVLQFEEKIFRAERLLEKIHRVARLVDLILHDQIWNLAREAAGQRDQTFAVRRENFFVNARLVIIALQMRGGGELDEIFIAGLILR